MAKPKDESVKTAEVSFNSVFSKYTMTATIIDVIFISIVLYVVWLFVTMQIMITFFGIVVFALIAALVLEYFKASFLKSFFTDESVNKTMSSVATS